MRLTLLVGLLLSTAAQAAEPPVIDVHRDANCGCCKAWIEHLQNSGFTVNDHVETDMSAIKARLGVPPRLASCHTGVIDGHFIEGHVPAADILRYRERKDLVGLAVPGMPHGSPGMETGRVDAYEVIGLGKDGQEQVVQRYP